MTIREVTHAAQQAVEAFELVLYNLNLGMSKSIQRLVARENREFIQNLKNALTSLSNEDQSLANNGQFDEIYERMIELRIACPEAGYPCSEAMYGSVEDWMESTGKSDLWD